jgi:lysophospholipase L1-like esterase
LRKKRPVLHHVDTQGWYGDGDHLDGIHPSAAGHVKIARRLREWLEAEGLLPAHGNDAGG